MSEYIEIGQAPCDEPCAQVGTLDYPANARKECRAYIQAIRRKLGPEPEGASLAVKSFPHDFGDYYEVVCYYDQNHPDSMDYAFCCERDAPQKWSDVGMEPPVRHGQGTRGK